VKPGRAEPAGSVPEWLEVVRLGHTDWRVSDSRVDSADPRRLVGFIEKLPTGRFELVWITYPIRWGYTDTLSAALSGMAEGAQFAGAIAERDSSVSTSLRSPYRRIHRRAAAETDIAASDVA
jgi:hypothetical protein